MRDYTTCYNLLKPRGEFEPTRAVLTFLPPLVPDAGVVEAEFRIFAFLAENESFYVGSLGKGRGSVG